MADNQTVPDLARLLRRLRRREARHRGGAELTYRELAAKTGWSLGIVAQYFSGKTLPPVDRFDVLIQLLGASPAEQGALATARDRVDEVRRSPGRPAPERGREIRLLGPVEAEGPQGPARLVGVRQRALVGLLALNAGRVVAQARLVDALWGEEPPRTAVRTLYTHVARVRRALDACGLRGVLRTQATGYLLAIGPDDVDATRFEMRVAQAREALAGGALTDAVARFREGLALWRGEALADATSHGWAACEVDRLREVHWGAQEDLWEARLRLGQHTEAVGELEKLLAARPGRERVVELLMLALYRCGRSTEALLAYQRLRAHLADELGVEPGPRLQQLHTAVLRHECALDLDGGAPGTAAAPVAATPRSPMPAQLPPRAGHFTGRAREIAVLDRLPDGDAQVGIVCGPAGMGKTALAVQWAHGAAEHFPDGQLFLDLRGHDPNAALSTGDALAQLLSGLGVPAAQIPPEPTAQVGLYRSTLNGRRVLVLLDNAASTDQIAALIPPSTTSLLLVTSRHRLTGLAVDHAVATVDIEVLPVDDALVLLGRILGAERVESEGTSARALVDLCDGMPLALRIAGAKLTAQSGRAIAALVAELTGADRLDALSVPGYSRSIRTVLAGAYRALSPPAAQLFRRLGQHPGPTFTAALAAALARRPEPEVRTALDELVAGHLVVDLGRQPERYRFHDLLGEYAHGCADPGEAEATTARLLDWYLTIADASNHVLEPSRNRAGPVDPDPPIESPFAAHHDEALSYLDGERDNILPVVRHAVIHGHDRTAWRLTYLLTSFHTLRGRWSAHVEVCRLGLAAAKRLADPAAEALMRSGLGVACNATLRHDEALEHLGRALSLMRSADDRRGQLVALSNMAISYGRLGRLEEASETFGLVLAEHTANNHLPGIAVALNNLGHTYAQMGQPGQALELLTRALTLTREIANPGFEAYTLHSIGEAHLTASDPDAALEPFTEALALRRQLGERRLEATTLTFIGLTHLRRADAAGAARHFRQALALSRDLGDRHLEATILDHLSAGRRDVRLRAFERDDPDRVGDCARGRVEDPDVEPPARRFGRSP